MSRLTFLLGIPLLASLAAVPASPARADSCVSRTNAEWRDYIQSESSSYPTMAEAEILDTLERCDSELRGKGLEACAANLKGWVKFKTWKSRGGGMGFLMSDQDYENSRPAEMVSLPAEFRDGLPANWKDIATVRGWPYLRYSSHLVLNPPFSTTSRLLFYIKGPDFDRWVQFTYPDGAQGHERLIDLIAVQKTAAPGGPALKHSRIHFRQYWRDTNGRNPQPRVAAVSFGDTCYSCHPNGLRQLVPVAGSLQPIDPVSSDAADPALANVAPAQLPRARLAQYNRKLGGYGQLDWGGTLEPEFHGPPLGGDRCIACHNGSDQPGSRGTINATTDKGHVRHKITGDQSMPMGEDLSPAERSLLYDQIYGNYDDDVRRWFTRNPCPAAYDETKCANAELNRRIAVALQGAPVENAGWVELQRALGGPLGLAADVLSYAGQCDTRKIVAAQRALGVGTGPAPVMDVGPDPGDLSGDREPAKVRSKKEKDRKKAKDKARAQAGSAKKKKNKAQAGADPRLGKPPEPKAPGQEKVKLKGREI